MGQSNRTRRNGFSEQELRILDLLGRQRMTFREVGLMLGVSAPYVSVVERKLIRQLSRTQAEIDRMHARIDEADEAVRRALDRRRQVLELYRG